MDEPDAPHAAHAPHAPAAAALSDADRSRFGFDGPEEELIARVREATASMDLGRVGGYELLAIAGTGGQGVVYKARQSATGREVALKRVLAGSWAGEGARARFAREIEADASLRHPNIVTVYGVEEVEGQPLLAMEWVEGVPIDRWAAGPDRSPTEVLRGFLKVCDGVQHAHQRGVIHRDLKPSNILVDAAGEPRVLDFGLAKVTASGSSLPSRLTATGGFLGTLAYSSPEQVRGDADSADVRTDVYALGCILYECLAGRAPFGGGSDMEALTRAICHDEPARPSTRRPGLDRDLDAIIAKAMAKDKAQRYPSVDALAADLRRHLAREPVEARRAGAGYRLRKFAARHRLGVLAGAVVALALVGGIAGTTAAMVTARAERARAEEEAGRAELVADLLQQMLSTADPHERKGPGYTVGQLLDDFDAGLAERLSGKPLVEAMVRVTIGRVYQDLGQLDKGERHSKIALDIAERDLPPDDLRRLDAEQQWVRILHDRGDYAQAEARLVPVVETLRRLGTPARHDLCSALANLSDLMVHRDAHAQAEPLAREALAINEDLLGPDHPEVAYTRVKLANVLEHRRDFAAAEALLCSALDTFRRRSGPQNPLVGKALYVLARVRRKQGDDPGAEAMFRESLAILRASLGEEHPDVPQCLHGLADVLDDTGRFDEAERLHREALDLRRRTRGGDHPDVSESLSGLATVLQHKGDFDAAEPLFRESLEMDRRLYGDGHQRVALGLDNLGVLLQHKGDFAGAEPLHREALAIFRKTLGDEHPDVAIALNNLAHVRLRRGDPAEAESCLRECLAIRRKLLRDDDPVRAQTPCILASVLASGHRHAEAVPYLRESLDAYRRADPGDSPAQALVLHHLADALRATGELDEARTLGAQALAQYDAHPEWSPGERNHAVSVLLQTLRDAGAHDEAIGVLLGEVERQRAAAPGSRALAGALALVGRDLLALERFADAEPVLRECLDLRLAVIPQDDPEAWLRSNTMSMLGGALAGRGLSLRPSEPGTAQALLDEAEPLLLRGYEGMRDDPGALRERTLQAMERLASFYEATGRGELAAAVRADAPPP